MTTETASISAAEAAARAIALAGGGAKLARLVGVIPQAVDGWRKRGVPPARVQVVADITGLPFHEIRPDVFKAQTASAEPCAVADAA